MRTHEYRTMAKRPYFIIAVVLACTVAPAAVRSQEIFDSEDFDAASTTVAPVYGADTLAGPCDCNYYDDGSIIDVLVVYTPAARLDNSSDDIDAYIQANVDVMNTVLENSRVRPRIRVVHTQEVAYDEGSDCNRVNPTLDLLLDPCDGYLDEVHDLRDTYCADIVVLYVRCKGAGGVAACNHGDQYILDPNGGFTVVASDWELFRLMGTTHEVGHILGCGHNRDAESSPGYPINCRSWSYSYGYDFIGESGRWNCTVMSYGPTLCGGVVGGRPCRPPGTICPDGRICKHLSPYDPGVRDFTIPYFSNPDVYFDGRPTGVPIGEANEADNVLTINVNAFKVANYRRRPGNIWVDFAYSGPEFGCFEQPYNTLSEGVSHVPEDGTLIFKAGSSSETAVISKRMTLKAFGGIVRIGE